MDLAALRYSQEGSLFTSSGREINVIELRSLLLKNEVVIDGSSKDILVDLVSACERLEWIDDQEA